MKKVIVALSADTIAVRELLMGIFGYANTRKDWSITLLESPYMLTPQRIRDAIDEGVAGVITGMRRRFDGYDALLKSGLPLTLFNFPEESPPPRSAKIATLLNDDTEIGRLGARYLMSRGRFRAYGFVPTPSKTPWSTLRHRGFVLVLRKHRLSSKVFKQGQESLADWLRRLPKPAAIMTAYDQIAAQVIEECRSQKIDVPGNIAVLGVDNDELVCLNMKPSLSSIHPNHVELARRAAQVLDRMMNGKVHSPPTPIAIPPIEVIERNSTRIVPPAGFLMSRALEFIKKNVATGITADDVVKSLGVSGSLLRLRFRTILGHSIRDEILSERLKVVEKMLGGTDESLSRIAKKSGFASACRLSHLFMERYGMSPTAWRRLIASRTQRR